MTLVTLIDLSYTICVNSGQIRANPFASHAFGTQVLRTTLNL